MGKRNGSGKLFFEGLKAMEKVLDLGIPFQE